MNPTPATPRNAVFAVIWILGIIAIVGMGFLGALSLLELPIPDALQGPVNIAIGAIAALLASSRTVPNDPVVPPPVQDVLTRLTPEQTEEMVTRLQGDPTNPDDVLPPA